MQVLGFGALAVVVGFLGMAADTLLPLASGTIFSH